MTEMMVSSERLYQRLENFISLPQCCSWAFSREHFGYTRIRIVFKNSHQESITGRSFTTKNWIKCSWADMAVIAKRFPAVAKFFTDKPSERVFIILHGARLCSTMVIRKPLNLNSLIESVSVYNVLALCYFALGESKSVKMCFLTFWTFGKRKLLMSRRVGLPILRQPVCRVLNFREGKRKGGNCDQRVAFTAFSH